MTTDITKQSTEAQIQFILVNPSLADRLTAADLKRIVKKLGSLTIALGQRAQDAEANYERLQAVLIEITGGTPPMWSYLHKEEAERLHAFEGFNLIVEETAAIVCGEEANILHPIYEYDFEDFGREDAEKKARSMLAHLRQTFLPRLNQPKETP